MMLMKTSTYLLHHYIHLDKLNICYLATLFLHCVSDYETLVIYTMYLALKISPHRLESQLVKEVDRNNEH